MLGASHATAAIEMAATEGSDETKTHDYIPGKLFNWELGLSFALYVGCH